MSGYGFVIRAQLVVSAPDRGHTAAVVADRREAAVIRDEGCVLLAECSELSGFVILWQKSHSTPSASPGVRADPSVGVERSANHPPVLWHRMHRSPAPSKSCSAMASVAQKIGSRPALAIMLPRQLWAGSTSAL